MSSTGKGPGFWKKVLFKEEPEEALRVTDEGYQEMRPEFVTSATDRAAGEFGQVPDDVSTKYAENKSLWITIQHVPSGETLFFKGFVTDYSDNFTSNWSSESVYGRMDEIHTFQNTTRQINLAFVMPAYNLTDARCNLAKATALMRYLYPYYAGSQNDNVSTIARAPLIRLGFVNLIQDGSSGGSTLLGKMNGFTFTPEFDHGVFDLKGFVYPKTININFTFDVLHEHIMGWTDTDDGDMEWSNGTAGSFPYSLPTVQGLDPFVEGAALFPEPTPADAAANADSVLGAGGSGDITTGFTTSFTDSD